MTDLLAQTLANPAVSTAGSAVAIALVALWLAAAWWAYSDAARRTESWFAGFLAAAWVVLSTPLLLPLALAVYRFARPQVTAAEQRARALVTALGSVTMSGPSCAACRAPVESGWLRCPDCATWLAAPCKGCGEWSDPALEICPWCGREGHDVPAVEPLAPVATASVPRNRRGRAARRAVAPGLPARQVTRHGYRRAAVAADVRAAEGRGAESRGADVRSAEDRLLAPARGRG